MARHKFNVGDRIRVVNDYLNYTYNPPPGAEGEVVTLEGQYLLVVDFGSSWRSAVGTSQYTIGHDGVELAVVRPFYLVAIQGGAEVVLKDHPTFDTGADAARYARQLAQTMGCKVQPRRVTDSSASDWRKREQMRLETGEYAPMPKGWDLIPISGHFLHLAKDDHTMVAFTESAEKGVLDRQARMSPGKYLNRYYDMPQEAMKRYIALIDKLAVVKFAKTADEIEDVYARGPDSCMAGPYEVEYDDEGEPLEEYGERDNESFESHCHPVRVYGDSDLQVAYLEIARKVTARTIVWPDRKIYVRIYGDTARLERALEVEGYERGDIDGAKIRKIKNRWGDNAIVMPYLDSCGRAREAGDDVFLVLDRDGPYAGDSTDGLASIRKVCQRTGESYDEEEQGFETVIVGVEPHREEEWSEGAVEDDAIRVYEPGMMFQSKLYSIDICTNVGNDVYEDYVPNHLLEQLCLKSDLDETWFRKESKVKLADGRVISNVQFDELGRHCAGNGKAYLESQGAHNPEFGDWYSHEFIAKRDARNARRRELRRLAAAQRQPVAA